MIMNVIIGCLSVLMPVAALAMYWNMHRGSRQIVVLGGYCGLGLVDQLNKKGWRTIAQAIRVEEIVSPDDYGSKVRMFGYRNVRLVWSRTFMDAVDHREIEKSAPGAFALLVGDIKLVLVTQKPHRDDHAARQLLASLESQGVPIVVEDSEAIPYNYGFKEKAKNPSRWQPATDSCSHSG